MNEQFQALDKKRVFYLVFCLAGAFVAGLGYTWSVLQSPFIAQLGGDEVKSVVVLCYTVVVVCSTMSPSVFGSFIKKIGQKKAIMIGAVLFGAGYMISGFTSNMIVFYIAFGLGTGIGSGLIYPVIMGYTASLFPDKQGIISGVVAALYGGAPIVWSPIIANMIEGQGLGISLLIVGIIGLAAPFIVAIVIRPVSSEYIEYKAASVKPGKSGKAALKAPDLTRGQMVKTGMFYVAIFAFAFGCTSGMMVISQVSSIMQESFAMTAVQAATYVSVCSFMSMIGRFLWGTLMDHFNKYVILSIICAVPIATMGVLAAVHTQSVCVVCLSVTALCYGGFGSTITPVTGDLFGKKHVSENYGVMYLAFGFAGLVGPQLAVNLSSNGDYSMAFLVAAVISAAAFVLSLLVMGKVRKIQRAAES